jgi:hypothetical protein
MSRLKADKAVSYENVTQTPQYQETGSNRGEHIVRVQTQLSQSDQVIAGGQVFAGSGSANPGKLG